MADQPSRTYSDLIALFVAAVILLIMISITEAAASHEQVVGNLNPSSRDHVRGVDSGVARRFASSPRMETAVAEP